MNLVLIPTQMVSGPIADWLGYRTFFWFVLLASVPSIFAAWQAPFRNVKDESEAPRGDADPRERAVG